ncbi:MAG: hypothetical protein M1836_006459 [Candelina mexicana]|nr:MAG: hypothetical protein M1836_006459 [Candelina mexicana]
MLELQTNINPIVAEDNLAIPSTTFNSFRGEIPLDVDAVCRELEDLTPSPENSDDGSERYPVPDFDAPRPKWGEHVYIHPRDPTPAPTSKPKSKPFTLADYIAKNGPVWRPSWITETLEKYKAIRSIEPECDYDPTDGALCPEIAPRSDSKAMKTAGGPYVLQVDNGGRTLSFDPTDGALCPEIANRPDSKAIQTVGGAYELQVDSGDRTLSPEPVSVQQRSARYVSLYKRSKVTPETDKHNQLFTIRSDSSNMSFVGEIPLDVEAVCERLRDLTESPETSDEECLQLLPPNLEAARAKASRVIDRYLQTWKPKSKTSISKKQSHIPSEPKPFTINDYYAKHGPVWRPRWITEALEQDKAAGAVDKAAHAVDNRSKYPKDPGAFIVEDGVFYDQEAMSKIPGGREGLREYARLRDTIKSRYDAGEAIGSDNRPLGNSMIQIGPAPRASSTVWEGRLRRRPAFIHKGTQPAPAQPHKTLLHRTTQPAKITKQLQSQQDRRKKPRKRTAARAADQSATSTPLSTSTPAHAQLPRSADNQRIRNGQERATKVKQSTRAVKGSKTNGQRKQAGSKNSRRGEKPTGIVKGRKSSRTRP